MLLLLLLWLLLLLLLLLSLWLCGYVVVVVVVVVALTIDDTVLLSLLLPAHLCKQGLLMFFCSCCRRCLSLSCRHCCPCKKFSVDFLSSVKITR